MPMDDKRLDEQLKATFEQQGRAARMSEKQLARLTDAVVQGVQQRSAWRSFMQDAWRWLGRLWYGETFISWRALSVTGVAAAVALVIMVQTSPPSPPSATETPWAGVPMEIVALELDAGAAPEPVGPRLVTMERVEIVEKVSRGM